ncbi:PREDICTED: endoplasmic reticulum metallopeptidase 1-like [Ipomoea nil]|uniref:endoplasmic reticulum metallopeptidase 1-like n=1 Tax=Ipomoea nil TaxID=35883 RepID=UPI000900A937|nr:PREDICTED: endoplasmic reticulum metallopeptidase 1-like [Ipomoea nil]
MAERSGYEIVVLFTFVVCGTWLVFYSQFKVLPEPLSAEEAGETGFSEVAAMNHVKALSQLGPHPLGSTALDTALQYVLQVAEGIKEEAFGDVNVDVEVFHANSGVNTLVGGLYFGKTPVYSDLKHVVMRLSPKSTADKLREGEDEEDAILVSAHVDTVFAAEGAGDDSSNVAVMLEVARGLSKQATGFKNNSVIFLFNTGEEEGLNGAHSFVTQHPWINTVRVAIDLEAMGIGGKSGIFQAGPDPWAIQNFAKVAKYPSGQVVSQDLFSSGVIKSSTDFQVYKEVAGLSGLDFAFTDHTAVYHTKNDKVALLKPGSLQHLGENLLPFLLQAASSSDLPTPNKTLSTGKSEDEDTVVYFDILGRYMVVYPRSFADMFHKAVIILSLLISIASLYMGGLSALISLVFSALSIVLMWIGSVSLSVLVAYVLPSVSSTPVPFVASPWLAIGLFAAPALLGAFVGQHVVYLFLHKFLSYTFSERKRSFILFVQDDEDVSECELEAERWMFKAGLLQWLLVLAVGTYLKIGSSYLALVWLVSPALAYVLLEAPAQSTKPLDPLTSLIGLTVPLAISSGVFVMLVNTLIGYLVRFVSNPGEQADWIPTAIVAVLIAAIVCLTMAYVLPYIHNSGAKSPFVITTCVLFVVSLGMVAMQMVPAFVDDTARAVNIVQVVDHTGNSSVVSHISLFSTTPGNLDVEAEKLGGFVCGRDKAFDFVTFSVKYSCWTEPTAKLGWKESRIPALRVGRDMEGDTRATLIHIDTAYSTRWSLGINTNEIKDFELKDESGVLVSVGGEKNGVDGWHVLRFAGGKNSPTEFNLTLQWHKNSSGKRIMEGSEGENLLLKLRADVNTKTPEMVAVLEKLLSWCSQYGKSSSPFTLAYLDAISVDSKPSLRMGSSVSVASE